MSAAVVTVIDYGRGNLFSVCRALEDLGARPELTSDPERIASADRLLLPGVGAFGDAMGALQQAGMAEAIRTSVGRGNPLLGICLGMQMLADESHEFGVHAGLGLIPGVVRRLPQNDQQKPKVPNVGWCRMDPPAGWDWRGSELARIDPGAYAYFVHSFHVQVENPAHVLAVTRFGDHDIAAVIRRDNIIGCQFHPEKSGKLGHEILLGWLENRISEQP